MPSNLHVGVLNLDTASSRHSTTQRHQRTYVPTTANSYDQVRPATPLYSSRVEYSQVAQPLYPPFTAINQVMQYDMNQQGLLPKLHTTSQNRAAYRRHEISIHITLDHFISLHDHPAGTKNERIIHDLHSRVALFGTFSFAYLPHHDRGSRLLSRFV